MKYLIFIALLIASQPITFRAPLHTTSEENLAVQYEWRFTWEKNGKPRWSTKIGVCRNEAANSDCSTFAPDFPVRNVSAEVYLVDIETGSRLIQLEAVNFSDAGELLYETFSAK